MCFLYLDKKKLRTYIYIYIKIAPDKFGSFVALISVEAMERKGEFVVSSK